MSDRDGEEKKRLKELTGAYRRERMDRRVARNAEDKMLAEQFRLGIAAIKDEIRGVHPGVNTNPRVRKNKRQVIMPNGLFLNEDAAAVVRAEGGKEFETLDGQPTVEEVHQHPDPVPAPTSEAVELTEADVDPADLISDDVFLPLPRKR